MNCGLEEPEERVTLFEERNKAFEEMNDILDANGDDRDDLLYRKAFERWQAIALRHVLDRKPWAIPHARTYGRYDRSGYVGRTALVFDPPPRIRTEH